jgi:hypothetical protein
MAETPLDDAVPTEVLADPSTWVEPRARLEDMVVRAVTDAALWSARGDASRRSRTRRRRRQRALAVLGAAAAVAVAAVVVLSTMMQTGQPPLDFSGTLAATALAPRAHADVEVRKTPAGYHVVLEAHRLPSLGPGEYYEAWLHDAAGTAVPIGTFSSGRDYVTLWSGVSPGTLPILTVTVERADNDQQSSGRVVLRGRMRADGRDR